MEDGKDYRIVPEIREGVLWLTWSGEVTEKNAMEMTKEYFDILMQYPGLDVISDVRALVGRASITATYYLARNLPKPEGLHRHRTAILELPENRSFAEFHEATSANAGTYLRYYFDEAEAMTWVKGGNGA